MCIKSIERTEGRKEVPAGMKEEKDRRGGRKEEISGNRKVANILLLKGTMEEARNNLFGLKEEGLQVDGQAKEGDKRRRPGTEIGEKYCLGGRRKMVRQLFWGVLVRRSRED